MRGHWISTTRKLNKHYQGGGTPPTPPPIDDLTLTWQRFMTTDAFCPVGFYNETDPTKISQYDPNNFYNKFVVNLSYTNTVIYNALSLPVLFNLAKSSKLIGPYNKISHYYIPAPDYGSLSYSDPSWMANQASEALLHNVPTFDPDYTSGTYHGTTYEDFGIRYTKFIVPKYLGSPYYSTYRDSGNNLRGQISFPVESKVDLSAIASKAFAEQYGSLAQEVGLLVKTPNGDNYGRSSMGTGASFCPYDLEQNGQAYIELQVAIPLNYGDTEYTGVNCRIYNFFYNGVFYLDHKLHFFDRTTGEEIQVGNHVSLWLLKYPFPLLGFCGMDPFYQPSDLYYPSYPSYEDIPGGTAGTMSLVGYYDSDGRARKYFTSYIKDWDSGTQFNPIRKHILYPEIVQEEVQENTFWATERAWHAIHGGTPYLTPSI